MDPSIKMKPKRRNRHLLVAAILGCLGLASGPAGADNYQTCKQAWFDSTAATGGYDCDWHWTKEDGYDSTGQLTCEVYVKCKMCLRAGNRICVGPWNSPNACEFKAQGWYRGYEDDLKTVVPKCVPDQSDTSSTDPDATDVCLRPPDEYC